ncbi:hypothetical protein [Longimicrobium sp.]|uniref:hypothetical protein n=1 Tax=Longimicrobium sp. TaxID=2029185 RepID=UPI002F95C38D
MTASASPDPQLLSCAIAGGYAGRWARAQVRRAEAEGAAVEPSPAWFVDAFAGADLQRAAIRGAAVEAGAIASVRAMADTVDGIRVVLADEDPGLLARLEDELERMGMAGRVRRTRDVASIAPGEIGLVESSFVALAAGLADAMGDSAALVRLAPLSARALPWTALRPIASRAETELLLRFPAEDFHKQARVSGPIADFPPNIRRLVEGCSALLGDGRHVWLAAWRDAVRRAGADAAVDDVVDRYRELIVGAGEGRIVRAQRLGSGAEAIHLLLATSSPAHVLELNGAIADGGADPLPPASPAADPEPEPEPEVVEPPIALDLFPVPPPPVEPKPRGPDLRAVADDLHARHCGSLVTYPDLLATLSDSGLTPEQVQEALAILKRAGRAAYRSLDAADAEIDFLLEPAAPPPPRKKKPRKAAPGELGLFDLPDDA